MEPIVVNLNLRMHSDRKGKDRSRVREYKGVDVDSFANIQFLLVGIELLTLSFSPFPVSALSALLTALDHSFESELPAALTDVNAAASC